MRNIRAELTLGHTSGGLDASRSRLGARWCVGALIILVSQFVVGCASPALKTQGNVLELSPQAAIRLNQLDGTVIWGGLLVERYAQEDATLVEILAFPLDRRQRPQFSQAPSGRFVVRIDAGGEAARQAARAPGTLVAGRAVTVLGELSGTAGAEVAGKALVWPHVLAQQWTVWGLPNVNDGPRVSFGLGVLLER